jgi:16S rRNA processing protein RimM
VAEGRRDAVRDRRPDLRASEEGCEGLILVGEVAGAHGIQGELKIATLDPGSESIRAGVSVHLGAENSAPVKVRSARRAGRALLVRLDGVDSREQAQALYKKQIWLKSEDLPRLKKDEFYLSEVAGFTVVDAAGTVLGTIQSELAGAPQATLVMRGAAPRDGKEILLPAREGVIVAFDRERKTLTVEVPEGLLDL